MSSLLIALLGVLVIPLFVATWRTSLFGLGCQGLLMALIAYRLDPHPNTVQDWLTLVDLAVVRGVAVPLLLYTVVRAQNAPARNDLIPPNLLSWTMALGMVLVSFSFSERLVDVAGEQRTLVAVAASGAMFGFLVLATQTSPFSQMVGALRIENTIALLELGGKRHESHFAIQLGLLAVFIATVALFRWYLTILGTDEADGQADVAGPPGPTL